MRSRVPNQTLDPLIYQSTWADPAPVEIEIEICVYVGGFGTETNREIVSFHSCVRAAVCKVRMDLKNNSRSFPFPFVAMGFLPFFPVRSGVPFPLRSLRSREAK